SLLQGALGLGVYIGLNWMIGTFVTPRVMGRYLKLHPFVVTVSVLAGAQLLGPAGALLALPGAAVLQAVMAERARAPSAAPALREVESRMNGTSPLWSLRRRRRCAPGGEEQS